MTGKGYFLSDRAQRSDCCMSLLQLHSSPCVQHANAPWNATGWFVSSLRWSVVILSLTGSPTAAAAAAGFGIMPPVSGGQSPAAHLFTALRQRLQQLLLLLLRRRQQQQRLRLHFLHISSQRRHRRLAWLGARAVVSSAGRTDDVVKDACDNRCPSPLHASVSSPALIISAVPLPSSFRRFAARHSLVPSLGFVPSGPRLRINADDDDYIRYPAVGRSSANK